jgi:hypothetical protein
MSIILKGVYRDYKSVVLLEPIDFRRNPFCTIFLVRYQHSLELNSFNVLGFSSANYGRNRQSAPGTQFVHRPITYLHNEGLQSTPS